MTSYYIAKTSLVGELLLVANPTQLTGVYFSGCAHVPTIKPEWRLDSRHPVLARAREEIQEFLDGKRTSFSLPVHFAGTEFQTRVWREIAGIPFGETITYTELAGRVGSISAVRAAGTATGRNPLSIVIPCHRVVGRDGSLHGYAGGLVRKEQLLKLEGRGSAGL